jgi:hypothetical protein
MTVLMDIEPGTLFVWPQQPQEIHRVVAQPYDSSGKTLARCVAWKNGESWVFATRGGDEEWNPLAEVQLIEIIISPIE